MKGKESRIQARERCTRSDIEPDSGPQACDAIEWFASDDFDREAATLYDIATEQRRERNSISDIHNLRRKIKDRIRTLEALENARGRISRKLRAELAELRIELCEVEVLLTAA